MKTELALSSFKLLNFKAIQDSKVIKFTPLTAFIGNNGSGKSSIIEAMETFQTLALQGIDTAMQPWHGFEYIWNRSTRHKTVASNPMIFRFRGLSNHKKFKVRLELSASENLNKVFFRQYYYGNGNSEFIDGSDYIVNGEIKDSSLKAFVENWQFLKLVPHIMTEPVFQKRTYGKIVLDKTGFNIAEYLQSIRDTNIQAFNGIVEMIKVILPYTTDLQPAVTSELERKVYLSLSEKNISIKLPGWLLSTGTWRLICLLAVLRHPEPPSVVVIEEIENGLDPGTIHILIDELRYFIESGKGQVIITTHSPYLLDLISLEHIIVTERDDSGTPRFTRPASEKELQEWAKNFSPGRLYTMGKLSRSFK